MNVRQQYLEANTRAVSLELEVSELTIKLNRLKTETEKAWALARDLRKQIPELHQP